MIIFSYYIIYFFVLFLISKFVFHSTGDKIKAFGLGVFSLSLCSLLLWIVQYNYNLFQDFYFPDEEKFFNSSETLANLTSLKEIFTESFQREYFSSNRLAVFIMGASGFIFNENTVLLQRMTVMMFAFLIPVLLYKLALYYVDSRIAFKCSLVFALLSYVLPYSCFILRDIHVMFFSLIMLILLHNKFSVSNVIAQVLIIVLVYFLRPESGVVVAFLFLYYIFVQRHDIAHKNVLFFVRFISFIVLLVCIRYSVSYLLMAIEGSTYYVNRTLSLAGTADGALTMIYSLPFGIRNIIIGFYSQMSPVPYWKALSIGKIPFIGFLFMLNAIFWFFVNYTVFKNFFFTKKVRLSSLLAFLYIFFILFLCFASSEIAHRRLMCFYPIPYIIFMVLYSRIKNEVKIDFFKSFIVYNLIGFVFIML